MRRIDWNNGWTLNDVPVFLPHDAMLSENRAPQNPSGSGGAFFAGGEYLYEKHFSSIIQSLQHINYFAQRTENFLIYRLHGILIICLEKIMQRQTTDNSDSPAGMHGGYS